MFHVILAFPQRPREIQHINMAKDLPLILEPEQLFPHLGDNDFIIVDLSSDQHYHQGHVPGAIHVTPQELVAGSPPAPGKLPNEERLRALFARLGLKPDSHVVVYDDEGGGWAGRFIWTLDVIGHSHYSYLNGGIWAWQASGQALSQDIPTVEATSVQFELNTAPMLDKEAIISSLGNPNFQVWDARSQEEYLGMRHTAQKNGHIPGAIHCEWTELMDQANQLRIRTDAAEYLQNKGFNKDGEIVTHCQTHHRSGFTYLVGKALGYTIKAYPGSWSEWGNDPDTPVET